MLRSSLLFTILAVLCALFLVEAVPTRGSSRRPSSPSRRPSLPPVRRPSSPIHRPPVVVHRPTSPHRPPVVVHRPTTPVQTHRPPVVVHRPTTPGQTGSHPSQGSPRPPVHVPSSTHSSVPPGATPSNGPPSSPVDRTPSPPPSALDQVSGCRAYTNCDTCASHSANRRVKIPDGKKQKTITVSCAWLQTTAQDRGSCVTIGPGVSHPANALSASAQQCDALHHAVQERHIAAKARTHWASIADHVYNGNADGKEAAGRHLTSTWITKFPEDKGKLAVNEETHFAKSNAKGKTLWMDSEATGEYKGPWTKAQIQALCITAIESSIRERVTGGRQTPESQRSESDVNMRTMTGRNAYSVRSPYGGNVCVEVFSDFSCFPAALAPTTKRAGDKCGAEGRILD